MLGGGGGGGTLIFSCVPVCRLELFFGVQNFESQYWGGGGFRKMKNDEIG